MYPFVYEYFIDSLKKAPIAGEPQLLGPLRFETTADRCKQFPIFDLNDQLKLN